MYRSLYLGTLKIVTADVALASYSCCTFVEDRP